MNFALIPFFIAANITGDQTDVWRHGPEYTFDASISYLLSADLSEKPFYGSNITSTLKCRPRNPDSLLCRLEGTTMNVYDDETPERFEIDDPFEIKFNERGVESLWFRKALGVTKLNAIRSIATQLSIGTNLKENLNALPAFVDKENFILGKCATLFTVLQHDKFQKRFPEEVPEKKYSLSVVALPERRPGSNVVIEKRTDCKRCTKPDENIFDQGPLATFQVHDMDIKIVKSFGKMQISDGDMFRSQTEIHVKVNRASGPKDSILRDIIAVELTGIEPAKEELPNESLKEKASLASSTMHYNFIL